MQTYTEEWKPVKEFPDYLVSNHGNIYNRRTDRYMMTSLTNHGHVKFTFTDQDGGYHTRSVGMIVAEMFVQQPHFLCNHIMPLDGNVENINAYNLVWRPRGFAWRYMRQLKRPQPEHYGVVPVWNESTGAGYISVMEAGIAEGALFDDIWRSTETGSDVYPLQARFVKIV